MKCSTWYFLSEEGAEEQERSRKGIKSRWVVGGEWRLTASGDITASQGHSTLCTHKVELSEEIYLAQGTLFSIWAFDWEELGCNNITTILSGYEKKEG